MEQPVNPGQMAQVQKMLQGIDPVTMKLRPYLTVVEATNFELNRLYELIGKKIEAKLSIEADEKVLAELRAAQVTAIEAYKNAHVRFTSDLTIK